MSRPSAIIQQGTLAARPVTLDTVEQGTLYYSTDTTELFRWSGTEWFLWSNFSGSGAPGAPGTILRSGTTAPDNAVGVNGDYYLNTVSGDLYKRTSGTYAVVGSLKGPPGAAGTSPTISIGTVSTLSPGASATVSRTGTPPDYSFNFGIPTGATGDPGSAGSAATVSVGTVTTVSPASPAAVTNAGTSSAAVFNFSIPQGAAGSAGAAATISVGSVTTGAAGSSATVTNAGTSSSAVFNFVIPRGDTGSAGSGSGGINVRRNSGTALAITQLNFADNTSGNGLTTTLALSGVTGEATLTLLGGNAISPEPTTFIGQGDLMPTYRGTSAPLHQFGQDDIHAACDFRVATGNVTIDTAYGGALGKKRNILVMAYNAGTISLTQSGVDLVLFNTLANTLSPPASKWLRLITIYNTGFNRAYNDLTPNANPTVTGDVTVTGLNAKSRVGGSDGTSTTIPGSITVPRFCTLTVGFNGIEYVFISLSSQSLSGASAEDRRAAISGTVTMPASGFGIRTIDQPVNCASVAATITINPASFYNATTNQSCVIYLYPTSVAGGTLTFGPSAGTTLNGSSASKVISAAYDVRRLFMRSATEIIIQ